jgi:hypothetical protein
MQIPGKITEADLKDVRKMARSKMYWLKFVLANWYGLAILCILIWATFGALIGDIKPNWRALGTIWLVIAAFFAFLYYRTKTAMKREFNDLNERLPDRISLATDGIHLDGPHGATGFQPWRNFKGWREGQRIFLIDQSQGGFFILPVAAFPPVQRETLRQMLDGQIPGARTPL